MQKNSITIYPEAPNKNQTVLPRQVAFAAAFLLPVGKFLEAPALLSRHAKGDILLPAILWFLIESLVLIAVLYAATRSEKTLCQRIDTAFGKWSMLVYLPFAAYYLFAALLPILDLEKFAYAAFFDTAPTTFYFATFFLFSGFFAAKGVKSIGRSADLCIFLFLLPFFALLIMSLTTADFSHLLPLFGTDFFGVLLGVRDTSPHFSDVALLLPLIANCRFTHKKTARTATETTLPSSTRGNFAQRGNEDNAKGGKPILLGYAVGAFFTLLLLATFYAVYSSLAPREHYAFSKIAQFFPALEVIGRIDLLFIYMLTLVQLFYTCLPVHYATECIAKSLRVTRRTWISAFLNFALFLFALFGNRFYNAFYAVISTRLAPVFWFVADMLPLLLLFLPKNGKPNLPPDTPSKPTPDLPTKNKVPSAQSAPEQVAPPALKAKNKEKKHA